MAVTFDAASTNGSGYRGASPLTWAHTCTGSDRGLIVGISWWNGGDPTNVAVTYNSVSMTQEADISASDAARVRIFSLIAPATGSNTISVSWAGSNTDPMVGGAVSVTGADQTDLIQRAASTNSGTSTTASVTVTSATGEFVVDTMTAPDTPTENGDGTQRWNVNGTGLFGAGASAPGAASVNMSWSLASSVAWAIAAVSIAPSAAGTVIPIFMNSYRQRWN